MVSVSFLLCCSRFFVFKSGEKRHKELYGKEDFSCCSFWKWSILIIYYMFICLYVYMFICLYVYMFIYYIFIYYLYIWYLVFVLFPYSFMVSIFCGRLPAAFCIWYQKGVLQGVLGTIIRYHFIMLYTPISARTPKSTVSISFQTIKQRPRVLSPDLC